MSAFQDALLEIYVRTKEFVFPTQPQAGIEGAMAAEVSGSWGFALGLFFAVPGAVMFWHDGPDDITYLRGTPVPAWDLAGPVLVLGAGQASFRLIRPVLPSSPGLSLGRTGGRRMTAEVSPRLKDSPWPASCGSPCCHRRSG